MGKCRRILVVAKSTSTASSLLTWLADDLREIVVTNTFAAAKYYLATKPDLLIAEVKLGEYNGLHLALRIRDAWRRTAPRHALSGMPSARCVFSSRTHGRVARARARFHGSPVHHHCGCLLENGCMTGNVAM